MSKSIQMIGWVFVALNALLYSAKFFLQSKGYEVSWLYGHGTDFENLKTISTTSSSSSDRALAKGWLVGLTLTAALLSVAAIIVIWNAFAT